MEHAPNGDDGGSFIPNEIDRVGKAFGGGQVIATRALAEYLGRAGNRDQLSLDTFHEVMTQADGTLRRPKKTGPDIGLREGGEEQAAAHDLPSRWAGTSSQLAPSVGLAS